MEITTDFNHTQMQRLVNRHRGHAADHIGALTVVYVHAWGDYWENSQEFIEKFTAVPQHHDIVVHVRFEGLSLHACGLHSIIHDMVKKQNRSHDKIFVFTPNSLVQDHWPWVNLFYNGFATITDEIYRAKDYAVETVPVDFEHCKTWALFVGRRTAPRMLALWHMTHCAELKDDCVVSVMNELVPPTKPMWLNEQRHYDHIERWNVPGIIDHLEPVLDWMQNCPVTSVDNVSVHDQYLGSGSENRNQKLISGILNLRQQYLFEITFETMTEGLTFTPSEKTVRSVMAEKPQFVYAAPGFLQHMRDLGFQTFADLWSENYDHLQGPARFVAMFQEIKKIGAMPQIQKIELYQQAQLICRHNRAVLDNLIHNHWANMGK